jgi:hypothetical protein
VSWFGHGLFCCVFLGKQTLQPERLFVENGFLLGRNDLPWDLAAQVDWIKNQAEWSKNPPKQEEARLWVKEIALVGDRDTSLQILCKELKKILQANGKK